MCWFDFVKSESILVLVNQIVLACPPDGVVDAYQIRFHSRKHTNILLKVIENKQELRQELPIWN